VRELMKARELIESARAPSLIVTASSLLEQRVG
jgi:hypothetical protein